MRYQLTYETKDGKKYYYGEYSSMADALVYFIKLNDLGDGIHSKDEIIMVTLTALAQS